MSPNGYDVRNDQTSIVLNAFKREQIHVMVQIGILLRRARYGSMKKIYKYIYIQQYTIFRTVVSVNNHDFLYY